MVQPATGLWQITGEAAYLQQDGTIADAAISRLISPSGILREPCADFILADAASIWNSDRNAANQCGLRRAGPFDVADASRQSSALDAFSAALAVAPG